MGLVKEVKTLGSVANTNAKPSTGKVYFAKEITKKDNDALQQKYVGKHP